jgi:hypothetical protein
MPSRAQRTPRPAPEGEKQFPVDDEQFAALADEVKAHGRTMLPRKRLWMLWQCIGNVVPLEGAAAEIGAYQGGSAYFIAASFAARLGHEVRLEVIDTFAGHPPGKLSAHDSPVHADETKFAATSFESVTDYLGAFEQVAVHQGEFAAVAPELPEQRYRLVHVDVDLYLPALECLEYFGTRLVRGGIVVLDDYGKPSCPGIRRAAEEFLAGGGYQTWNALTRQLVLVKR